MERYSSDIFAFQRPRWTIQSLEVYWEFRTPNAPLVAESFGTHTSDYFRRHRKRMHLSEIDYNAGYVSYTYQMRKQNVSVVLYAKTQDCICIECRFTSYPKSMYAAFTDRAYSPSSLLATSSMISALAEKARLEMAPLRQAHKTYNQRDVIRRWELVSALAAFSHMAGHNQIIIQRIIQNLLINQRVVETSDRQYNEALRRMVERKLLKRLPKTPRQPQSYSLTGAMKKIIGALNN